MSDQVLKLSHALGLLRSFGLIIEQIIFQVLQVLYHPIPVKLEQLEVVKNPTDEWGVDLLDWVNWVLAECVRDWLLDQRLGVLYWLLDWLLHRHRHWLRQRLIIWLNRHLLLLGNILWELLVGKWRRLHWLNWLTHWLDWLLDWSRSCLLPRKIELDWSLLRLLCHW